jgi:hypothetical protein
VPAIPGFAYNGGDTDWKAKWALDTKRRQVRKRRVDMGSRELAMLIRVRQMTAVKALSRLVERGWERRELPPTARGEHGQRLAPSYVELRPLGAKPQVAREALQAPPAETLHAPSEADHGQDVSPARTRSASRPTRANGETPGRARSASHIASSSTAGSTSLLPVLEKHGVKRSQRGGSEPPSAQELALYGGKHAAEGGRVPRQASSYPDPRTGKTVRVPPAENDRPRKRRGGF